MNDQVHACIKYNVYTCMMGGTHMSPIHMHVQYISDSHLTSIYASRLHSVIIYLLVYLAMYMLNQPVGKHVYV